VGYVWHSNRHTFCSWLAIAGVPLKTIQELAGHKTIAITAQYAHLCPDHKQSEVEKISKAPKIRKQRSPAVRVQGNPLSCCSQPDKPAPIRKSA
jgi:hypothetical protein